MKPIRIALVCISAASITGCATLESTQKTVVTSEPLYESSSCSGRFISHELPHITKAESDPPVFFDSNGSGVALTDLDDDGLIDIVLSGLQSPVTILWNKGDLQFERTEIPLLRTRAVYAVDVDGEGRIDLVFTISTELPSWWRAEGPSRNFVQTTDEELAAWFYFYTLGWSDFDGDGDLDMIGATYDQEIAHRNEGRVVGGGVFYLENTDDGFEFLRLGRETQTLAISLIDLDLDGRRDVVVGNDFRVPDYIYMNTEEGWVVDEPLVNTTENTMSFAEGDIDNDGTLEFYATDMKPYDTSDEVLADWKPMYVDMEPFRPNDGVQVMANVLQVRNNDGIFIDRALDAGVDATGWTWSVQFGDLDHDGFLDLYVVNGMIATEVFEHLPDSELVEENQAFRNNADGTFSTAPEWGLGATESGRGMAMADLDLDGDLDIVVNNLESPAVLFENQICGGSSLEIDLRWNGTRNIRAIGATVEVETNNGDYLREVRASSGYASSDPSRLHFGFPQGTEIISANVTWPDGATLTIQDIEPNTLVTIVR